MEKKYSKQEFEGYTHRFVVQFEMGDPFYHTISIYSNNDSKEDLVAAINRYKSEKVLSFEIVHRATKEMDIAVTDLLDNLLTH